MKGKRVKYINIFWVALTVVIAICTVVVSISTLGDMLRTRRDRKIVEANIKSDSIFIHKITTSPEFMEQYARETYHMQRKGETVYIME